tara:strand:- start:610 stop:1071 length:462 start_codon:yes stop_codon:yes gene_type:complete
VDEDLAHDEMINAVAVMFGVRWDAVKNAVVRRIKIDDEETEKHGPIWTIIPRSKRCDAYELKGLNLMCHDDNIFRFSSRRSEPLREHVGVGEYKIHWACEVPNEMQDVVQIYLHDPRAVQYAAPTVVMVVGSKRPRCRMQEAGCKRQAVGGRL